MASQALNPNPQVADFALFATNSISVGTSVTVSGGDIGVKNAGAGPFLVSGFELAIGGTSQVNAARNVIADSIQLGASSSVICPGNSDRLDHEICFFTTPSETMAMPSTERSITAITESGRGAAAAVLPRTRTGVSFARRWPAFGSKPFCRAERRIRSLNGHM
jgi:hypothetical protein